MKYYTKIRYFKFNIKTDKELGICQNNIRMDNEVLSRTRSIVYAVYKKKKNKMRCPLVSILNLMYKLYTTINIKLLY